MVGCVVVSRYWDPLVFFFLFIRRNGVLGTNHYLILQECSVSKRDDIKSPDLEQDWARAIVP